MQPPSRPNAASQVPQCSPPSTPPAPLSSQGSPPVHPRADPPAHPIQTPPPSHGSSGHPSLSPRPCVCRRPGSGRSAPQPHGWFQCHLTAESPCTLTGSNVLVLLFPPVRRKLCSVLCFLSKPRCAFCNLGEILSNSSVLPFPPIPACSKTTGQLSGAGGDGSGLWGTKWPWLPECFPSFDSGEMGNPRVGCSAAAPAESSAQLQGFVSLRRYLLQAGRG